MWFIVRGSCTDSSVSWHRSYGKNFPVSVAINRLRSHFTTFVHLRHHAVRHCFRDINVFGNRPRLLFRVHHRPNVAPQRLTTRVGLDTTAIAISIRQLRATNLIQQRSSRGSEQIARLCLAGRKVQVSRTYDRNQSFLVSAICGSFASRRITALCTLLSGVAIGLRVNCGALRKGSRYRRALTWMYWALLTLFYRQPFKCSHKNNKKSILPRTTNNNSRPNR